jgi:hypothetical protein
VGAFTQTNVKFKLSKLVKSADSKLGNVKYPEDVATGIEGCFMTLKARNESKELTPFPQLAKSAMWKVNVKDRPVFNDATLAFTNEFLENIEDGMYLTITHRRQRVTRMWIEDPDPQQYQVTYIEDGDGFGAVLTLYLKSKDSA